MSGEETSRAEPRPWLKGETFQVVIVSSHLEISWMSDAPACQSSPCRDGTESAMIRKEVVCPAVCSFLRREVSVWMNATWRLWCLWVFMTRFTAIFALNLTHESKITAESFTLHEQPIYLQSIMLVFSEALMASNLWHDYLLQTCLLIMFIVYFKMQCLKFALEYLD